MNTAVAEKTKEPERTITSRRFVLPDWTDTRNWLLPRLKVKWPHLQDNQVDGWIRSIIDSPEFMFIRTGNAVACAQMVRDTLSPVPEAVEKFVLAKDREEAEHIRECLYLYGDLIRWAQNIGARDMTVEQFTDVPHPVIAQRLGRVFTRETVFVRVANKG
jgi:hypothetical protein